jgi:Protein of unknown function (DUF3455)
MTTKHSIAPLAQLTVLLGCLGVAHAQAALLPQVPEALRPPAGERVVLKTHATGAQVYVCATAADGKSQWTLKGPDAELRDGKGALVGHHDAGPVWRLTDGSEVTGKAVAHADSPEPQAIPWLLLSVVSHAGSGALSAVTHIQRLNTHGGQPPPATQCDASSRSTETRSSYSADYYFYAPEAGETPQGNPY